MMPMSFAAASEYVYAYGMNILLTNDDGIDAPGLHAAYQAVRSLGTVYVVAPKHERSACSHMITLRAPIQVEHHTAHRTYGTCYVVDGAPADCVRLAVAALIEQPINLVVSGINRGANAGVDVFYSGTIAAAREGAILGIHAIAVSQAVRSDVPVDWNAARDVTRYLVERLINEPLPDRGFWSINLPAPISDNPRAHIHRVPLATHPMPMSFKRIDEIPSTANTNADASTNTNAQANTNVNTEPDTARTSDRAPTMNRTVDLNRAATVRERKEDPASHGDESTAKLSADRHTEASGRSGEITGAETPDHEAPLFGPAAIDHGAKSAGRSVRTMAFEYGASYWIRDETGPSDYTTIRDGGIAVTAVPLFGGF